MNSTHSETVSAKDIILFRSPPWVLRLTIRNDRSYPRIKIVRAAPLSYPDRFIAILDDKDVEIDVDAQYRLLVDAGLNPDGPQDAPWGERYFHIDDPDGHQLSFAELLPRS